MEVISKGMLTTVQDAGRTGWQQYGVPVCGAMDGLSMELANLLVGNAPDAAVLEITGLGPTLKFEENTCFAICGADFGGRLEGNPMQVGKAYYAPAGSTLALGAAKTGFRACIAFAGGIDLPPVMGSRATYLKGKFGGFCGRALEKGDKLPLGPCPWLFDLDKRELDPAWHKELLSRRPIRVVLGPQDSAFSARGIETFLNTEYTVTPESDRMGFRLDADALIEYAPGRDGNIISDGIAMGAIQIPSGKPIVMMADRQTTGGYAKIANIIACDLPRFAQKKAGDKVRFAAVTPAEARQALLRRRRALEDLAARLGSEE